MHTVPLPDPLYNEAQRAAEASGVSLERFIREAVRLHIQDEPDLGAVQLSPEQIAIVRKGQAEIEAGKFLTAEQVKAELVAHRAAWLQANPD